MKRNGRFTLAVLLATASLAAAGCGRRGDVATSIQIKGSDTMVNLGQAWAEAFMQKHPDLSVAVTGGGSGTGIASLIAGSCDIAELSRDMKPDEIAMARKNGIEPKQLEVALDGLAVVVHPANPVSELTMGQLAQIFSGAITNWKDVGGADRQIVVLSREVNSGTHLYFKEHVLRHGRADGKEEFAPGALMLPSSQAIADEVAQNPGAIGYYGMGYISPRQKALHVSLEPGAPHVAPTLENVINKSYPISRPLLMVSKGQPHGLTAQFLDFVLSPEGQKLVGELDFVPVRR